MDRTRAGTKVMALMVDGHEDGHEDGPEAKARAIATDMARRVDGPGDMVTVDRAWLTALLGATARTLPLLDTLADKAAEMRRESYAVSVRSVHTRLWTLREFGLASYSSTEAPARCDHCGEVIASYAESDGYTDLEGRGFLVHANGFGCRSLARITAEEVVA